MQMITTDPRKKKNKNFFFINDITTREGNMEYEFANKVIKYANQFNVIILQQKKSQGMAIFLKYRGYGNDIFDLNEFCKTVQI